MSRLLPRAELLFCLPVLTLVYPCCASTPVPAPPVFQPLYTLLQTNLQTFNETLRTGDGSRYPSLYAGNLTRANGNTGPALVNITRISGVQGQLQELKAMGVGAIMVEIGFPMLYEPFLTSQGQSQADYVSFYQQVADMVRAAGLKLIVENNILLTNDVQTGWDLANFYSTLDWTAYQQARAQTALTIVQTMHPDYLVALQEPDTEASNTGQTSVNTSDGATALLSQILAGLQPYRKNGLKVGAGVGTWLYTFQSFISAFVAQPLDFIDMHIYPVNLGFLPRALTIATTAASAGLPVTISECWLNKVDDDELKILPVDQVRARNPFSFWASLDAYFMRTMSNLANYTQMAFVAPTNSDYYWAYLPYDSSTKGLDAGTILSQEISTSSANMNLASYTTTAMHYYNYLVRQSDTTPPSVPTGLSGNSGNPTTAYLTWVDASDNVGVAGYYVLRDGSIVSTTSNPSFQDTELTEGSTYSYAVESFDLAGNVSPSTISIQVRTKELTPPSAPTNLTTTVISKQQINLTWSPSTDNAGIRCYLLFQGTSPNHLSQVAETNGATTTHSVYNLTSGTKYYFALQSQDTWGNISQMSNLVSATTLP